MQFHELGTSDAERTTPGDFRSKISEGRLLVPKELAEVLAKLSIRSAEHFVSFLYTFPTEIMVRLKWEKIEDLLRARESLVCELRGLVSEEFLGTVANRVKRSFGAKSPLDDHVHNESL